MTTTVVVVTVTVAAVAAVVVVLAVVVVVVVGGGWWSVPHGCYVLHNPQLHAVGETCSFMINYHARLGEQSRQR